MILSSGALFGGFDETKVDKISESERHAPAYADDLQALSIGKRVAEFLTKNSVVKVTLMLRSHGASASLALACLRTCIMLSEILWRKLLPVKI